MKLLLASNSPRRRELLASLGWRFEALSPEIDETSRGGESPSEMALRLAEEKSAAVSAGYPQYLTIGADTVVDVDGVALGKPLDLADSLRMLKMLNGRSHLVHTGIGLSLHGRLKKSALCTTKVNFASLSESEMLIFAESGYGADKAGAYAIQGRGALLVESVEGCYYNVVGLPLFLLNSLIREICDTGNDS